MATTAPNVGFLTLRPTVNPEVHPRESVKVRRQRKISPEAGRAIEILGHAIDYLADEFTLDCLSSGVRGRSGPHPRMAAIQLLMERNREIYLSCPELPPLGERLQARLPNWLRPRRTPGHTSLPS